VPFEGVGVSIRGCRKGVLCFSGVIDLPNIWAMLRFSLDELFVETASEQSTAGIGRHQLGGSWKPDGFMVGKHFEACKMATCSFGLRRREDHVCTFLTMARSDTTPHVSRIEVDQIHLMRFSGLASMKKKCG
jgi:hypothetical protein